MGCGCHVTSEHFSAGGALSSLSLQGASCRKRSGAAGSRVTPVRQACSVPQECRMAILCMGSRMWPLWPDVRGPGMDFWNRLLDHLSLKVGKLRPRETGFAWIPQYLWAQRDASPGKPEGIPAPEVSTAHEAGCPFPERPCLLPWSYSARCAPSWESISVRSIPPSLAGRLS